MIQSYAPFRTGLLDPHELRLLNAPRPMIPVRDTLVHWVLIAMTLAAVAYYPAYWAVGLAMVLIGVNQYGLYIIGHDGLHRRLFPDVRTNDLWNDMMVIGSFGAITRLNRHNHMTHHRVTCLPGDPDRHKYTHDGKDPVLPFLAFLSGLSNLWPSVRNVFWPSSPSPVPSQATEAPGNHDSYSLRDIAILAGWQLGLFGALTMAVGWWAYPTLWLAPFYLFAYRGDLTRVFCEHSMLTTDAAADGSMRLISYTSSWLERQFFAPHNMNHHIVHHLWPSIPYYNLPRADGIIRQSDIVRGREPRLVWRRSYLGYLARYFRWRLANPQPRAEAVA
jgi:fatty acid desaturase